MKEIKPFQVLVFVLGILLILLPIVLYVPKNGWNIAGLNINFLGKESLWHPTEQIKKDITTLVAKVDTTSIEIEIDTLIKHRNGSNGNMGAPNGGTLSSESATEIHLNETGLSNLHVFFRKLQDAANYEKKLHILHYGDSQIEGDRMTAYIRQRIQNQFGGNGPGLIPAMNVYNTFTFKQTYSDNFMRYTCFGGNKLKNRKYGSMGSAARFSPELDSARLQRETTVKEAWIEISPGKSSYSRSREYNNISMYYNSCLKPCLVKVFQNGNLIHEDSLIQDGKAHTLDLNFPTTPGKLKFVFSAAVSPTISGFSLEGDFGVQVSNIGMRGSSGMIFGSMDQTILAKMYADLNTELILMQFGGNSVPFFKDSSSVRSYANSFKSQLNTIKKLRPSAAILVIGPSDMSKLENGIFVSYPYLSYCVAQMKKVTLEVGGGYWDLYSAMGGKNSMPSWVEKGLAGKDYIHFSNQGASIISQLFFDAFAAEFAKWQLNTIE